MQPFFHKRLPILLVLKFHMFFLQRFFAFYLYRSPTVRLRLLYFVPSNVKEEELVISVHKKLSLQAIFVSTILATFSKGRSALYVLYRDKVVEDILLTAGPKLQRRLSFWFFGSLKSGGFWGRGVIFSVIF
jgi:hypothetical protein